jgi:hypothetical protein
LWAARSHVPDDEKEKTMKTQKNKRIVMVLGALSLGLLVAAPWAAVSGNEGGMVSPEQPWSDRSLEGIWTTMVATPVGHSSINSFIITAQGSEGMVYTVVGKHPQCSPTALGMFPDAERLSDMMGYCVRTGADTFRLSVIYHGVKEGGPERMGIGEIVYMAVLTGTAELVDRETLVLKDATLAGYTPAQDVDGDRLPDEGATPVVCMQMPLTTFKRLPMFRSCEPTPMPIPGQ